MTNRKNRFNLFKKDLFKSKLNKLGDKNKLKSDSSKERDDYSHFASFDSIIPESSPLKKSSNSDSGFYNDEFSSKSISNNDFSSKEVSNDNFGSRDVSKENLSSDDLDGVDEKYAKYIYFNDSEDFNDSSEDNLENNLDDYLGDDLGNNLNEDGLNEEHLNKNPKERSLKKGLLNFKRDLSNKSNSSKSSFGKIVILLVVLVLISSIFYFFIYQPFQSELNLEKNSKLNEVHALYKGPLALNDNAYTLENRINKAYDVEEIKSIDVVRSATKDWRLYHSSKIVSSKDDFGRVMMSYGENRNILMSVKDANDFVKDNDAKILSNVQFEKVNTVIVPISLSRLQATGGLISVGSVVDIYSLSDNSSDYPQEYDDTGNLSSVPLNETSVDDSLEETSEDEPIVSGATVLAILRSKDSGLVDSTVSKSNTIIKGNETKPFENTSSYSSDVEELLKAAVLNSSKNDNVLDSYLTNYGIRLSNFERMSNLGDLDSEYIILLEVPQSDVNFVINNMDSLVLTIPTEFAPNWVVNELSETYYENLYQNQSLDFL